MTTIIEQQYALNSVVFDANYATGSIRDWSPNNATASITAPAQWSNTKYGYGVRFINAGLISYADNASNRLAGSDATWIFLGNFSNLNTARFVSKRAVGGTSYDISTFISGSDRRIYLWDGSNSRYGVVPTYNYSFIVITLNSGQAAKVYGNGSYIIDLNGTSTIPNRTDPLLVGGYYDPGTQTPCIAPLNRVTILNRALSSSEIAQLHTELVHQKYPLRAYSFGKRLSPIEDPPGCPSLLKTDFTTKLRDGRLADLSGNGWHGTIKPGFVAGPGMFGNSLISTSTTYVDFGDVSSINNAQKLTVLWYGKRSSVDTGVVLNKGIADGNRNDITFTTTGLYWLIGTGNVNVSDSNIGISSFSAWAYDGYQANENNRIRLQTDNSIRTLTRSGSIPSTLPNTIGQVLQLGQISWTPLFKPTPQNDFFAIYPNALTESQVSFIYKQIARRQTFELDMQKVPVTLANMVGPIDVPNTPFRVLDGTWKVGEDSSGKRWINSVATNNKNVYMVSKQAYGTWVCTIYHTAGDEYFAFISNCNDLSLATRNVYSVLLTGTTLSLYRFSPGSSSVLMSSTSCIVASKIYKIAVSRDNSGQFTVYIKGDLYTNWTKVVATTGTNPATDTNYKTSSNCVLSTSPAASGGGFADFQFYQGVLTADDLNQMGL